LSTASESKLRIGVAGLGRAFAVDFSANAYGTVEELCADPTVEVIYVATPHQWHARHALLAARHRKHLLVEKPIALTLQECTAIIDAARSAGVHLVVGHSHSFDAPVRRLRNLIESGRYGDMRMINAINYTDYLYRPRRPEELDTTLGGGAIFNQAAHQIDIVRLLGGGRVESVRAATGAWDKTRPTEGAYAALLMFANGAFASLTYSGYGNFDSDEFQGWIGEMGQKKMPYAGSPRRRFDNQQDEIAFKNARNYGGPEFRLSAGQDLAHQNFGTLLVSCERADLRALPNGVMIYQNGSAQLDALPAPTIPRVEVIDELYDAVVRNQPPLHNGAWGMATLEVLLAILQSSREKLEVRLSHQVSR